ncbi:MULTISPECIES: hypothetical protein [Paraburkholderia]|uniref:Uncharacterized protein n=2 Tax=Paraburkholderia TaxID=1822464 RepID=A0A1H7EFE8_9BURK|nr:MULTISPECIES: hypothetical protein [Paraburkholderia]MCO4882294.1 hypothetical protein [Paraburkholderia caribensis]SEK12588.1 hypothetical protein SAMN05192539_105912 [Paraburkholderia diazotrophica]
MLVFTELGDRLVSRLDEISYPPVGRLEAFRITLPDSFTEAISSFVRSGALVID